MMKSIESIDIYYVEMPLIYPFRTAFGNDHVIGSVLVRLKAGDLFGWGEASPWQYPTYSSEWGRGSFIVIRDFLGPCILNNTFESGQALQEKMSWVKGNYFAKAALDLAWWDLYAKDLSQPLWKVIGGQKDTIEVGADFGIMDSIDDLIKTMEVAVREGFKRIKLKYRPGWELEMIRAVRNSFPDTIIHVDCNSAYSLDDLPMFQELDQFNLAMIEQPLMHDDLIDHAELQRHLRTPICLDESITSADRVRKAAKVKACGWINIKPGRVGGITNAIAIHNASQAAGIPCWIGGMLESSVGSTFCLSLASLPNIKYPSDIFPTERFYRKDLGYPQMVLSGPSQMQLSSNPGIGVEPDPRQLKQQTIEHFKLAS
jgi:o-succinylbenzoate synthase